MGVGAVAAELGAPCFEPVAKAGGMPPESMTVAVTGSGALADVVSEIFDVELEQTGRHHHT